MIYYYCKKIPKKYKKKELGRSFSVWQPNPKYNTDYIDNNVRTKWLQKLEDMEKEYNKEMR